MSAQMLPNLPLANLADKTQTPGTSNCRLKLAIYTSSLT